MGLTAPTERRMSPVRALQVTIQDHERIIDGTLASSSDLIGRALRLGLLAGTRPDVSEPILDELANSLNAAIAMRKANLRAHRMMDKVAKSLNFRELGYGDEVAKPEINPASDDVFTPRRTAASVSA